MSLYRLFPVFLCAALAINVGCRSRSRPGVSESGGWYRQAVAASQAGVVSAAERAMDRLGYARENGITSLNGAEVVSALDRQANRIEVRVLPTSGRATVYECRVTPGNNESLSLAVLDAVRKEVREDALSR